jgi:hypothetical protein
MVNIGGADLFSIEIQSFYLFNRIFISCKSLLMLAISLAVVSNVELGNPFPSKEVF